MRDPSYFYQANKGFFVLMTSSESDLSSEGSSFKFILPTGSEIQMKCLKSFSDPYSKTLIYSGEIANILTFDIHYSLYQVSADNTTVVLIEFTNISTIKTEIADIMRSTSEKAFDMLSLFIQQSTLALFQNEGAIILKSIGELWDLIVDWNVAKKLTAIPVDAFILLQGTGQSVLEPGMTFKLIFLKEHEAYFRIKSIDKSEGSSKWELVFEYLSSSLFFFKELRIIMIAISPNATQISVCHRFALSETPDRIQLMGVIKKRILTKLKAIAENSSGNVCYINKQGVNTGNDK